jgi:hypothetical protein
MCGALKEWFDDRDLGTDLRLSLNKNRLASMGSNCCDHIKLGFKDAAAMEKAHKAVDLKYLRQTSRMAVRIFHDAVFEHPTKETAARTKLHSILQNNEVSKILRGAIDDADDEWIAQLWQIPAVQIWGKICHKYEGMTDMLVYMLTGTMMEEVANIIKCVTGDARQRRTISAPRPERLQTSQTWCHTWQRRDFQCTTSISETATANTSSRTS